MARVLIVGDDLTGANATAALYAHNGLRAATILSPMTARRLCADVDVLACTTNSRHMQAREAAALVRQVVMGLGPSVDVVVKRVDTTLRGNIGAELAAALEAVRQIDPTTRHIGLVVPAFPASGRSTVGGYQLVGGTPILMSAVADDPLTPVRSSDVRSIIGEQTDLRSANITLDTVMAGTDAIASALESRARDCDLIVVDSVTEGQQQAIARAAARIEHHGIKWTIFDSGPFGAVYVDSLGIRSRKDRRAPVLAIFGSPTEFTRRQADVVESNLEASLFPVCDSNADIEGACEAVDRAMEEGRRVVGIKTTARTSSGLSGVGAKKMLHFIAGFARTCCEAHHFSGLYVTGGDAAVTVLESLGAEGYAVESEVLPLAVCGAVVGGSHDGLGFATKGGLIGGPDAAVRCIEALRARHSMPEAISERG